MYCQNCGHKNNPTNNFCSECGHSIQILFDQELFIPRYKKKLIVVVAAIFTILVSIEVTNFMGGLFTSNTSLNSQIIKIISEKNKNCPIRMDKHTRLDYITFGAEKEIIYNFTFINDTTEDIDINLLIGVQRLIILNKFKSSDDINIFRDNAVTFVYRYSDSTGKYMFNIKIAPDDYK